MDLELNFSLGAPWSKAARVPPDERPPLIYLGMPFSTNSDLPTVDFYVSLSPLYGPATSYQWYINDEPQGLVITEPTRSITLTVSNTSETDGYIYYIAVYNSHGNDHSNEAIQHWDISNAATPIADIVITYEGSSNPLVARVTTVFVKFDESKDPPNLPGELNLRIQDSLPLQGVIEETGDPYILKFHFAEDNLDLIGPGVDMLWYRWEFISEFIGSSVFSENSSNFRYIQAMPLPPEANICIQYNEEGQEYGDGLLTRWVSSGSTTGADLIPDPALGFPNAIHEGELAYLKATVADPEHFGASNFFPENTYTIDSNEYSVFAAIKLNSYNTIGSPIGNVSGPVYFKANLETDTSEYAFGQTVDSNSIGSSITEEQLRKLIVLSYRLSDEDEYSTHDLYNYGIRHRIDDASPLNGLWFYLGRFSGHICEVFIVCSPLTMKQNENIHAWLMKKWGETPPDIIDDFDNDDFFDGDFK